MMAWKARVVGLGKDEDDDLSSGRDCCLMLRQTARLESLVGTQSLLIWLRYLLL